MGQTATAKKPTKLKIGDRIKVELTCEITGKPFIVRVAVQQVNDTPFLLKWRGEKWYKTLTDEGRQVVANEINEQEGNGSERLAEFNEMYAETTETA